MTLRDIAGAIVCTLIVLAWGVYQGWRSEVRSRWWREMDCGRVKPEKPKRDAD